MQTPLRHIATSEILTPEAKSFLVEVGQLKPLSAKDEHDLAQKLKTLDPESPDAQRLAEILFKANLRWALNLTYTSSRLDFMTRFAYASIGLWRAIWKYDPDKEIDGKPVRISTYATYWIRQAMQRGADDEEHLIRIPSHVHDCYKFICRQIRAYYKTFGVEPTVEQLADYSGLSADKIISVQQCMQRTVSLDGDRILANNNPDFRAQKARFFDTTPVPSTEETCIDLEEQTQIRLFLQDVIAFVEAEVPLYAAVLRVHFSIDDHTYTLREFSDTATRLDLSPRKAKALYNEAIAWVASHRSALQALAVQQGVL